MDENHDAMDAMAMEEKPLLENKDDDSNSLDNQEHEMILCCICQCSTKETRDLSCCGCFPIKFGVIMIGVITIFLCLAIFVELMYSIMNEYM